MLVTDNPRGSTYPKTFYIADGEKWSKFLIQKSTVSVKNLDSRTPPWPDLVG